ncbi:hypothetical protein LDENG_00022480 [Lucifuga dentata]|nr:hypothetical protein LDENG_00022480 [Lucifuga dentata]
MLSSHPNTHQTTAIAYFMVHPPKSSANFSMSRTLLLSSSLTPTLMTNDPILLNLHRLLIPQRIQFKLLPHPIKLSITRPCPISLSSFTTILHHAASVLLDRTS